MAALKPTSAVPEKIETAPHPDAELVALVEQYKAAYKRSSQLNLAFDRKYGAASSSSPLPRGYRTAEREEKKAWRACGRIEARIAATPAVTLWGMLAKVRVAQACTGEYDMEFASGGAPEAMAQSIFADILRNTSADLTFTLQSAGAGLRSSAHGP